MDKLKEFAPALSSCLYNELVTRHSFVLFCVFLQNRANTSELMITNCDIGGLERCGVAS